MDGPEKGTMSLTPTLGVCVCAFLDNERVLGALIIEPVGIPPRLFSSP